MAKRQITIDDGSKKREQVELNLNPVSLSPAVRAGGNYRVVVQDTPKTNAAMQLSSALKAGVGLYSQAVDVAQNKAQEDVATMSEEDFNTFLEQGLDKESRSIFGYTKAYNHALAKKYYAEEMPTKLQAIATELHKDPYQYKDPQHFEAAATAAVDEAYAEADELLGGNVFSEQANNALKSATKADFVEKQQEAYLHKLPEITRQIQSDTAFKVFSEITDTDKVKESINQQLTAVKSAVGNNRDAAAIVTKSYLDVVELMAQEGKHDEAQQMLDELDSTELASLGMQGKRKFGKGNVELFNTAENRARIEAVQDAIENDSARSMTLKKNRALGAIAGIENELFSTLTGEGGSEEKGFEYTQKLLDDIAKNQSLTIGDKVYDDPIEIKAIRDSLLAVQSNPQLFKLTAMNNFIATNGQSEQYAISQLENPDTIQVLNKDAYSILVDDNNWKKGKPAYTKKGITFTTNFAKEKRRLEHALFESISYLQDGEKQRQFAALYPEKVTAPMQAWVTQTLEGLAPSEDEQDVTKQRRADALAYLSEKQRAKIKASAVDSEEEQELQDILIQEAKDEEYLRQSAQVFNGEVDEEGNRQLKSRLSSPALQHSAIKEAEKGKPPVHKIVSKSFDKAEKFDIYDSETEKISLHSQLVSSWERPRGSSEIYDGVYADRSLIGTSVKDSAYRAFAYKRKYGGFAEEDIVDRAAKRTKMVNFYNRYGVSAKELLNDAPDINKYWRDSDRHFKSDITISGMFGGVDKVDFRLFPITVNGSVESIALTVSDYFKAKEEDDLEGFYAEDFGRIADKYFKGDLDALMTAQRTYLQQHKFITK